MNKKISIDYWLTLSSERAEQPNQRWRTWGASLNARNHSCGKDSRPHSQRTWGGSNTKAQYTYQ